MNRILLVLVLAVLADHVLAGPAPGSRSPYQNVTQGGALRPGVYGRIEFGRAPPPPLIRAQPVVAVSTLSAVPAVPVYLYVPPGHVRKWRQHCAKYEACETPVYFVRLDDSPSKLGAWKRTASRDAAAYGPGRVGVRELFSLR